MMQMGRDQVFTQITQTRELKIARNVGKETLKRIGTAWTDLQRISHLRILLNLHKGPTVKKWK